MVARPSVFTKTRAGREKRSGAVHYNGQAAQQAASKRRAERATLTLRRRVESRTNAR